MSAHDYFFSNSMQSFQTEIPYLKKKNVPAHLHLLCENKIYICDTNAKILQWTPVCALRDWQ